MTDTVKTKQRPTRFKKHEDRLLRRAARLGRLTITDVIRKGALSNARRIVRRAEKQKAPAKLVTA